MNQASNILSVGGHHLLSREGEGISWKHDLASTNALQSRSSGTVDLAEACSRTARSFKLLDTANNATSLWAATDRYAGTGQAGLFHLQTVARKFQWLGST